MILPHYMKTLTETQRAQPSCPSSLRDRFEARCSSLPAVSRDCRFSMSEFEAALKTQGKYISPVLLELGWLRKRMWSTTGQYHRYWVPPANPDRAGTRTHRSLSACPCRRHGRSSARRWPARVS